MYSNSPKNIKEKQGACSLFTGALTPMMAQVCYQVNPDTSCFCQASPWENYTITNFSTGKVLSGKSDAGLEDAITE